MKIEFDSIDEYFEFMQRTSNPDMKLVVKTQENKIMILEKEKEQLKNHIKQQQDHIKRLENENIGEPEINQNIVIHHEKLHEPKSKKTIRDYTKNTYNLFPKVKGLKPNGKFILGTGIESKYSIYDIFKLKKYLPDLNLTYVDLGELIGVSHATAKILCCAIEDGFFDPWFEEWTEMQSKLPTRKNFVENNPEKRKALMGMG